MNGYLEIFEQPYYQTRKSIEKMPSSVVRLTVKSWSSYGHPKKKLELLIFSAGGSMRKVGRKI